MVRLVTVKRQQAACMVPAVLPEVIDNCIRIAARDTNINISTAPDAVLLFRRCGLVCYQEKICICCPGN